MLDTIDMPHLVVKQAFVSGRDVDHQSYPKERVEIGCYGAQGRTGTALACLAVLCGHPPDDAVRWTRETYCVRAVETPDQEAFVRTFPH